MSQPQLLAADIAGGGLRKETNWWGVEISGRQAIGTRKAAKVIAREAARLNMSAIVVGAPARRRRGDWSWGNEAYRVERHASVPVHVVPAPPV